MRDPRLAEIDFLMSLEAAGLLPVRSTTTVDTSGASVPGAGQELYGLTPMQFRDLVVHLLRHELIAGPHARTYGGSGISELGLDRERDELLKTLTSGQPVDLYMTHAGRTRLWDLRDALMRDPDIEPMGLRSKAAWERDLFLRLRWAAKDSPLAIMFVDLDDFGKVNKLLGHPVGDDVLRATFTLVKNLVGARGAVYRYGGEEIGILMPDTAQHAAETVAEELRQVIATEVVRQVPVLGKHQTASIGVASFITPTEARAAVAHVDALMKKSKNTGKNKVSAEAFAA